MIGDRPLIWDQFPQSEDVMLGIAAFYRQPRIGIFPWKTRHWPYSGLDRVVFVEGRAASKQAVFTRSSIEENFHYSIYLR
jgi:hypothetical protein